MSKIFESINDPKVVQYLMNGKVGIIPTDTLYGVVCRASDPNSCEKLYKLKSRDKKPGTIIASSIDQLISLGLKARYLKVVEHFWPGPVSVEIPNSIVQLTQGTGKAAFRVINDQYISILLSNTGPLLTSSANIPGEPPANNLKEAMDYFGDKVDFYVDGGDLSYREPSTVVRIVDDVVEVIRQGAVKIDESGRIIE
ncbi:L-threonylcarbamoyladenylate synthase [Candidatus Saccharibacteria bacterium]|nr:L-threonylcarbamoyladenylate synthase [Candidatus Saccharibacteria bacterium]